MEQKSPGQRLERKGAPMMWYFFAAVLVIVTVVALSVFGGAPGHPAS